MRRQKEPRCSVLPLSANQLRLDLGSFCLFLGVTNMVFEDLSGMKIGRWRVVGCTQRRSRGLPTKFLCVCECGEEREIQAGALKGGGRVNPVAVGHENLHPRGLKRTA